MLSVCYSHEVSTWSLSCDHIVLIIILYVEKHIIGSCFRELIIVFMSKVNFFIFMTFENKPGFFKDSLAGLGEYTHTLWFCSIMFLPHARLKAMRSRQILLVLGSSDTKHNLAFVLMVFACKEDLSSVMGL